MATGQVLNQTTQWGKEPDAQYRPFWLQAPKSVAAGGACTITLANCPLYDDKSNEYTVEILNSDGLATSSVRYKNTGTATLYNNGNWQVIRTQTVYVDIFAASNVYIDKEITVNIYGAVSASSLTKPLVGRTKITILSAVKDGVDCVLLETEDGEYVDQITKPGKYSVYVVALYADGTLARCYPRSFTAVVDDLNGNRLNGWGSVTAGVIKISAVPDSGVMTLKFFDHFTESRVYREESASFQIFKPDEAHVFVSLDTTGLYGTAYPTSMYVERGSDVQKNIFVRCAGASECGAVLDGTTLDRSNTGILKIGVPATFEHDTASVRIVSDGKFVFGGVYDRLSNTMLDSLDVMYNMVDFPVGTGTKRNKYVTVDVQDVSGHDAQSNPLKLMYTSSRFMFDDTREYPKVGILANTLGKTCYLSDIDLRGGDISDGFTFYNATVRNATVKGCSFINSNATNSVLSGCRLSGMKQPKSGTAVNAITDDSDCSYYGCRIVFSTLADFYCKKTLVRGSYVEIKPFYSCSVSGTEISNSTGNIFENCGFVQCYVHDSHMPEFDRYGYVEGCVFERVTGRYVNIRSSSKFKLSDGSLVNTGGSQKYMNYVTWIGIDAPKLPQGSCDTVMNRCYSEWEDSVAGLPDSDEYEIEFSDDKISDKFGVPVYVASDEQKKEDEYNSLITPSIRSALEMYSGRSNMPNQAYIDLYYNILPLVKGFYKSCFGYTDSYMRGRDFNIEQAIWTYVTEGNTIKEFVETQRRFEAEQERRAAEEREMREAEAAAAYRARVEADAASRLAEKKKYEAELDEFLRSETGQRVSAVKGVGVAKMFFALQKDGKNPQYRYGNVMYDDHEICEKYDLLYWCPNGSYETIATGREGAVEEGCWKCPGGGGTLVSRDCTKTYMLSGWL